MSEQNKMKNESKGQASTHHECNCQGRCKVCHCRQKEDGKESFAVLPS